MYIFLLNNTRKFLSQQVLKKYLETLPSVDEFERQKNDFDLTVQRNELLEKRLQSANKGIEEKTKAFSEVESKICLLQLENEDLKKVLKYEKASNELNRQLLNEPKNHSLKNYAALSESYDILKEERNKLKKYVMLSKSKHDNAMAEVTNQLENLMFKNGQLARENEILKDQEIQHAKANAHLREQVQGAFGQVSDLRGKVSCLETSLRSAEQREEKIEKQDEVVLKMNRLVEQTESLSMAFEQLTQGKEPNVSGLLGVDPSSPKSPNNNQFVQEDFYGTIDNLIAKQEDNLASLRTTISDKYAQTVADDSEGCLTQ